MTTERYDGTFRRGAALPSPAACRTAPPARPGTDGEAW